MNNKDKNPNLEELKNTICNLSDENFKSLIEELVGDLSDRHLLNINDFIEKYTTCIYPYWKDNLSEIYPIKGFKKFNEIIITGAVGIGKTTIPLYMLAYELYYLLNVYEPHRKLGILKDSKLVFNLFYVNHLMSVKSYFDTIINNIPEIKNKIKSEKEGEYILFENNIEVRFNSIKNYRPELGVVHYLSIFNLEYPIDTQPNKILNKTYLDILNRCQARFQNKEGMIGGVILAGYPDSSLINDRLEIQSSKYLKLSKMSDWEVNPYRKPTTNKTFAVCTGNGRFLEPKILEKDEDVNDYPTNCIINVPEDFRSSFEKDLIRSLRDLAGVRTDFSRMYNAIEKKSANVFEDKPKETKDKSIPKIQVDILTGKILNDDIVSKAIKEDKKVLGYNPETLKDILDDKEEVFNILKSNRIGTGVVNPFCRSYSSIEELKELFKYVSDILTPAMVYKVGNEIILNYGNKLYSCTEIKNEDI